MPQFPAAPVRIAAPRRICWVRSTSSAETSGRDRDRGHDMVESRLGHVGFIAIVAVPDMFAVFDAECLERRDEHCFGLRRHGCLRLDEMSPRAAAPSASHAGQPRREACAPWR